MIGERLSEARKDHGDTQAKLAEKLNVSLPTIRSWEQEKSSPSHDMLISICKLYHVSSDYLLGLTDADPRYVHAEKLQRFSPQELLALQYFEEFLLWKRKNNKS